MSRQQLAKGQYRASKIGVGSCGCARIHSVHWALEKSMDGPTIDPRDE
jgi:hypothetical protein